jgi:hypothetical protein
VNPILCNYTLQNPADCSITNISGVTGNMLHYELDTEAFIIVLLPYTFIHTSCMCAEIHVAETKASYLYFFGGLLGGALCISVRAASVSGLQVNDFVGVLFNDTVNC